MPEHGIRPPMHWFSPVHRGIVPLDGLVVSRSLRRSCRDFEIRVDTAFDEVVAHCADPARDAGWITRDIAAAYGELHRLGWAHSVESWRDGELAGGLYGVGIGGLFAGESMYHRVRDASKVALVGLVSLMTADGVDGRLLDVQWVTPHLATLGAVEVPRPAYLGLLERALRLPARRGRVKPHEAGTALGRGPPRGSGLVSCGGEDGRVRRGGKEGGRLSCPSRSSAPRRRSSRTPSPRRTPPTWPRECRRSGMRPRSSRTSGRQRPSRTTPARASMLTLDKLIGLPDDAAESDLLDVLDFGEDERAKSMAFEDYLDDSCPYREGSDG